MIWARGVSTQPWRCGFGSLVSRQQYTFPRSPTRFSSSYFNAETLSTPTPLPSTPIPLEHLAKHKIEDAELDEVDSNLDPTHENLSEEQKHVLKLVLSGKSVFFTGSAGTGKSFLLRTIIKELRSRLPYNSVAVTSSTGVSALNIGGTTIHSLAGIGYSGLHAYLLLRKSRSFSTQRRWSQTRVLIIDEISMINARLFDVLNDIAKDACRSNKPFGEIQLIVCGDFFQLPPVPEQGSVDANIPVSFAFEAQCWDEALPNKVMLTKVFRQTDPKLIKILNDMRRGIVSEESSLLLQHLSRPIQYSDGIHPVVIFPRRGAAEAENRSQMNKILGEQMKFQAVDKIGCDICGQPITPERGRMLLDKLIPEEITLKVGAQVMCTQNFSDVGIVNGSVGTVIRFSRPYDERVTREFLITIPNPDSLWQPGMPAPAPAASPWERQRWPVVRYQSGTSMLMIPTEFKHLNANGGEEVARKQLPLIPAWALTVHKAQGKTLSRVKVDLAGTFENGQAYVAISRCKTLDGLEVQNFTPNIVFAHPKVVEWSERLTNATIVENSQVPTELRDSPAPFLGHQRG